MYSIKKSCRERIVFFVYWLGTIIGLMAAGIAYSQAADYMQVISQRCLDLPVALKSFPAEIGGWVGKDIPLSDSVIRAAGNDDFVNRLYVNEMLRQRVTFYVAYSARPRTMNGHKPDVCYVASGWVHDGSKPSSFKTATGKEIPCQMHYFHKPDRPGTQMAVLNFYVLNGRCIFSEKGFSGIAWRTPNITGTPARYVAQIQISSAVEGSIFSAAGKFADLILDYLPDVNGQVRAAAVAEVISERDTLNRVAVR